MEFGIEKLIMKSVKRETTKRIELQNQENHQNTWGKGKCNWNIGADNIKIMKENV